jgi:hypothetical protein
MLDGEDTVFALLLDGLIATVGGMQARRLSFLLHKQSSAEWRQARAIW